MTHVTFAFEPTEEDCELAALAAEELDSCELFVLWPVHEPEPAESRLPSIQTALSTLGDLAERVAGVLPSVRVPSGLARTVRP